MKLVSEYVTTSVETTLNYEYENKKEFQDHKFEMQSQGIFVHVWHQCKDGRYIASYVDVIEKKG